MPGGLLQLISNGTQDSYLSLKPEFTFFKFIYNRHTNFSKTYSNINLKTKSKFSSNNIIEIPKYGDLLSNINLLVKLPQINIEYTDTKFNLLHSIKNNTHFKNNIEFLNSINNIKSINNSLQNISLYNTTIHFYDSNIDIYNIYSNIIKIYHLFNTNTSLTTSNIYFQLNNTLLSDHNTTSSIFNDFNLFSDSQFNQTRNILVDNDNTTTTIKSLLNLTYNNNINPLLVYLNTKSNDNYEFNYGNLYLQKLFYKLLYYYTNNDYNLLSYFLISSKNYIENDNTLIINNFDTLNILQNNYLLINTLDTINSNNILFVCDSDIFDLKNIKSILILKKTYINNNYLFELDNNIKSSSFFLSNSIYNLNLSSNEIIYDVTNDDGFTMTLDKIDSLEINMILFGYNNDSNILPQTNPDFYIKILRIQNNDIEYELFNNYLDVYNLNYLQQNTNDYNTSNKLTYLINDNTVLTPTDYTIYYSDIWNNFNFLYNSTNYSIKSLNKYDFYTLAIDSSKNTLNNQKNILTNIINSYLIDSLYVSLSFIINQSTLVVDDYIETNLNENSFVSITNKFTRNNDSTYSINDSSYTEDNFVNKYLNIFFDTKDNFKIRINNSYSNIFTKNITSYTEIYDINNLISYFSQTTPFFTLKLHLTSDQISNGNILFLDQNDNLSSLALSNNIIFIYTTDVSTNYQINNIEDEANNFIGIYNIKSIDINNESLDVQIYGDYTNYSDRLITDEYLYLVYKDEDNNIFYKLKCENKFIDEDKLIINSTNTNFISYSNYSYGEDTENPIDDYGTYYIYEISNNNFNLLSAIYIKSITISHIISGELYFFIDSSENFNYNFDFTTYSYFAFKFENDEINLEKGIKISSITFNSRFFNSNISQYNNISDTITRGYKYTNILHIYLCLFLYDQLKSSSTYLNNILLFRLNHISSKIYNLITSNSNYNTDLENLTGSIKLTFLADFSTIFNSNTIINELFDNSNNIFDSYFLDLKQFLTNKTLYDKDDNNNIITYQYTYDTNYYKTNLNDNTFEEITDSNIISMIIEYFSKTLSNLYDSDLNSFYNNFNKELFYIASNDFVINEYLNIIDYTYYDNIDSKISSNIGTHFFNLIDNENFLNKNVLNGIIEDSILIYGNIHIMSDKDNYLSLLNSHYDSFLDNQTNFLSYESLINNVSNLDITDNLLLSDDEIKNLFYTSLNLDVSDNVDFDNIIELIFNETEINKSLHTFLSNMTLDNEIFNYVNKFVFSLSIYQIYSYLPTFIKFYTFNELYKYDNSIDSGTYVIIDNLHIPDSLNDSFNEKITYINSLSSEEVEIEKNIFNFQRTFLKILKDVYFTDNSSFLTVKDLEINVNSNNLLNEDYKFVRGSLITNDEYNSINFDPLECNILSINSNGSILSIYIPFDLNSLFFYNDDYPLTLSLIDSKLQIVTKNDPYPANNTLSNYNVDELTFNINIKFQKNIKNVEKVVDNNVGITVNGIILKNSYFNSINSITAPNSIYKVAIESNYYYNYTYLSESSKIISIGDTLTLYNSSLINSSNLLNISIIVSDISDNIITFSTSYNINIDENIYAMIDNDNGFKFQSIEVQSFRLNLMYYFDQLSNVESNYNSYINDNNDFNYYSGNFINALSDITNTYFDNSNYNNDKLRHNDGHSKIVAISLDGYPIYGPYGYVNNLVSKISSSYKLKNSFTTERINLIETLNGEITNYGIGSFVEDYEYVENYGHLDEFNGRYCITPDFPNGTYAYFITVDNNDNPVFPYIITDTFYGSTSDVLSNFNIGLDTNSSAYNVNDNVVIIGNGGKYGTGIILSDSNNIKYVSLVNEGFDYETGKISLLKELPSTLEYVDEYRLLIRRKSIFGNGYYYDFDNNMLKIINIGDISSESDYNNSFLNLSNLIIDIENMYYNGNDPILQIVEDNEDILQILFLDEYVNYLSILSGDNNIINNLFNYVNTSNVNISNLLNDMISLLFSEYKKFYYLYYDNINIVKDYNLNNITLENFINSNVFEDEIMDELDNEFNNIEENNNNLIDYYLNESIILNRLDNPNYNWISNLGNFLFNKIELYMNDLLIDRHYSEWINIWYELNNTYEKKELREKLIGSTYDLFSNNSNIKESKNLIIPTFFWFNRYSGLNLPVLAMSNVKIYLKLYIEDLNNLVVKDDYTNIVLEEDLDIKLNIGYIYLDSDERNKFTKARHEYLIENTQYNEYTLNENSNLVDICFKNSVKDLIWFVDYEDRVLGTYETLIKNTKISVNNTILLNMDNIYTNYVIPYERYKACAPNGVNVYSFNLSNDDYQPSGSLNFSMLDNVKFDLTLLDNNLKNKKVKIFANSYNILRIMSGLAGLSFIE